MSCIPDERVIVELNDVKKVVREIRIVSARDVLENNRVLLSDR